MNIKAKSKKLLAAAALSTGAMLVEGCPLPLPGTSGYSHHEPDASRGDAGADAGTGGAPGPHEPASDGGAGPDRGEGGDGGGERP